LWSSEYCLFAHCSLLKLLYTNHSIVLYGLNMSLNTQPVFNLSFLLNSYNRYFYVAIGIAWLILVNSLMIADVWDETNALVILSAEPVASASLFEAARMFWLQELPLDIYRPLGSTFFIVFAKLTNGSFIFLRYVNAAFILASAVLFSSVLNQQGQSNGQSIHESKAKALIFYTIFLFSSSSVITAGWFANVFDASCLFFIALATKFYSTKNYFGYGISMVLAIYCKEAYVLSIPFFFLAIFQARDTNVKAIALVSLSVITFSAIYWLARHSVSPLGSEADIHGFSAANFFASSLSFLSGFWFQFSKFTPSSPIIIVGVIAVIISIVGLKSTAGKITLVSIYIMSAVIYWGMFSFQGSDIVTAHNFVARLYLIPFVLGLYLICKEGNKPAIVIIALLSTWGMGASYSDHKVFQNSYLELYKLSRETDEQVVAHYPEKPLVDSNRNLLIGDYPDAPISINPRTGEIERK
jgi:hypothetical protein